VIPPERGVASRAITALVLVDTVDAAPPAREGVLVVVCDGSWTPLPGARADLIPIRPAFAEVLGVEDLRAVSLGLVDAWAVRAGLVDALTVDGISYWFRLRETLWNWLHARILWRRTLGVLTAGLPPGCRLEVLATDDALRDGADAMAAAGLVTMTPDQPSAMATAGPPAVDSRPSAARAAAPRRGLMQRARGLIGRGAPARPSPAQERLAALERRAIAWAAAEGPRLLAVSLGVRHVVGGGSSATRADPHLDAVIDAWRAAGRRAGVVLVGTDHTADEDWASIADDPDAFPFSMLRTRWRPAQAPVIDLRLPEPGSVPLLVDGVDMGDRLLDQVRAFASRGLISVARLLPAIERMLAELRPDALLLTHEGHREPWIVAARRAGIPSFAIQHGILYATHPGYAHPRHPARPLVDCTFVYGDYERRALLEHGAYRPDEVEVSGSPRLDLDRVTAAGAAAERAETRAALGVAEGDRLLVISTTNGVVGRSVEFPELLGRIFSGPLPMVHVVFKLHPGEADEGPYRATVRGVAAAGGFEPPTMDAVRDIDLYALLRSADAHLGYNSTVLTEAVFAGTPNLIVTGQAYGDVIGYAEARVARPISGRDELLDALDRPVAPDPASRQAFIDDHFRAGAAGERIATRMAERITRAAGEDPGGAVS